MRDEAEASGLGNVELSELVLTEQERTVIGLALGMFLDDMKQQEGADCALDVVMPVWNKIAKYNTRAADALINVFDLFASVNFDEDDQPEPTLDELLDEIAGGYSGA